ncbi:hypothetical protein BGZ63DRAFT_403227 [Mariannaea sp. PMI_226]|nr:hypothetical protein BGZ63DRAFT_403227 [Mariannaea sp. PMI_226]
MTVLQFVNITQPSDAQSNHTQKLIKRHVMKDIGRARRKRPRAQVIELRVRPHSTQPNCLGSKQVKLQTSPSYPTVDYPLQVPRPPMASGVFGMDLDERDLQIVHIMRAEADYKYRPFHAVWIRIGLSDPTAFYLSLASTILFQDHRQGLMHMEYLENPESMKYYCKALSQLNTRLAHPEDCMSVGVIATILGCVCHDTNVGNWSRWAVHLDGLERISKLRGGFDGLENEIPLMAFWYNRNLPE